MNLTETLNNMYDDMMNGNWSNSIKEFQAINPTAQEYSEYLSEITDMEQLRDMALLGFYAREFLPRG